MVQYRIVYDRLQRYYVDHDAVEKAQETNPEEVNGMTLPIICTDMHRIVTESRRNNRLRKVAHMHKAQRIYVTVLIAVLAVLLLFLTYIRLKDNDYFEKMTTDAGYIDMEEVLQEDLSEADYVLVAEGFQQIYFYSGTYRLTVEATAASVDAYCQVIDLWTNTVLAEFDYDSDEYRHDIWFTTTRNYENVVVRSYVAAADVIETEDNGGDISDLLDIVSYNMQSEGTVCTDSKWTVILFALLLMLLGYGGYRMVCVGKPALFAVTTMAFIASLPFLNDYLPSSHDWMFHMARIFSLGQSFVDGQIPQHMNVTMATADITPNLYPELVLYFAGFLCATGATAWFGYQVTQILITFLTAFLAYYSARQAGGQQTALIFTFIYLANPYRLNELYVRGAIGQAFGMAFLPLIVVGMWKILCCSGGMNHKSGAVDLVIGFTGMISAHIIMSVISAFLCIVMVAVVFLVHPIRFVKNVKRILWILSAAIVTVFLNLWFLIPFLQLFGLETGISASATPIRMQESTPYLWQVFMGITEYGADAGSSKSAASEMSLTVGVALLIGLVLFVWMNLIDLMNEHRYKGIRSAKEGSEGMKSPSVFLSSDEKKIGGMCLVIGIAFLYMSSPYFPWEWMCESFEIIEMTLGKIQFSWRLLSVVAFMLSALLVVVLRALYRQRNACSVAVFVGILLICLLSAVSSGTSYYSNGTAMYDKFSCTYKIYSDYELSWADSDRVESWFLSGEGPQALAETENDANASIRIIDYYRDGTDYVFTYENSSDQDVMITVPVLWYGLHTAYLVDDNSKEEVALDSSVNDTLQFTDIVLPAGSEGTVSLEYTEPLGWKAADRISMATALLLIAVWIYGRRGYIERCVDWKTRFSAATGGPDRNGQGGGI